MRLKTRIWIVGVLVCAVAALSAPTAFGAFGVTKWEAGTCAENTQTEPCTAETPAKYYTQAAGHPNYGITDFRFKTSGAAGFEKPEGNVKKVRVDLPAGLSVNPYATPRCKVAELESSAGCPEDTQVGEVELTAHLNLEIFWDTPLALRSARRFLHQRRRLQHGTAAGHAAGSGLQGGSL